MDSCCLCFYCFSLFFSSAIYCTGRSLYMSFLNVSVVIDRFGLFVCVSIVLILLSAAVFHKAIVTLNFLCVFVVIDEFGLVFFVLLLFFLLIFPDSVFRKLIVTPMIVLCFYC